MYKHASVRIFVNATCRFLNRPSGFIDYIGLRTSCCYLCSASPGNHPVSNLGQRRRGSQLFEAADSSSGPSGSGKKKTKNKKAKGKKSKKKAKSSKRKGKKSKKKGKKSSSSSSESSSDSSSGSSSDSNESDDSSEAG